MEDVPGYPDLKQADFYLLHDALATWLSDNTPYFASNPATELYKGLPLSEVEVGSHELEIPGTVVRQLTPQASRVLCVASSDYIEAAYLPPQYVRDAPGEKPWEVSPTTSIRLIDDTGRTNAMYHNGLTDPSLSWSVNTSRTISHRFGGPQMAACLEIAQHLPAYHVEMDRRGMLPEDLLAYRQERDFAVKAAKLAASTEKALRQATEERLAKAPTWGVLDVETADRVQYNTATKAYRHISRDETQALRQEIAEVMMQHDISMYVFSGELAAKISPAFHEPVARRTSVTDVSLVTRASKYGPVFSFIVTKDVLLRTGVQRTETDSFLLLGDKYIRMATRQDAGSGRYLSIQIDEQQPMTRSQYEVFKGLLPWIDKAK